MKKILLSCAIISLLSSNVFALNIHKGHLISEKTWTTSNEVQLVIDHSSPKKHFVASKRKEKSGFADTYVSTMISNTNNISEGFVNALTPIKANHAFAAENRTDKNQTYHYCYDLCAEIGDNSHQCATHCIDFELAPEGSAEVNEDLVLYATFKKPGIHETFITNSLDSFTNHGFYGTETNSRSSTFVKIS